MDATQICLSKIAVFSFNILFVKYLKVENMAEISTSTHRILFDPSGRRYIGGQPGEISFLSLDQSSDIRLKFD